MGSCFTTELFDGKLNETELRRQYEVRLGELTYEHGHDAYNGTLATTNGLVIDTKTFDSRQAAEEYVMNNTQKWEAARAVKVKDIRTEIVKAPTFDGKTRQHTVCTSVGERTLQTVTTVWRDNSSFPVAADQLVASKKATAIALYSDYETKLRAFNTLRNSVNQILTQWQVVTAEPPTTAELRELHKAIKQRAKAHSVMQKAAAKLVAFDTKHGAKLLITKQVDHGVQWLVGGWAAE